MKKHQLGLNKHTQHLVVTTLYAVAGIFLFVGVMSSLSPIVHAVEKQSVDCSILPDAICKSSDASPQSNGIWQLLLLILNIMTAGVGVLAVAGVVWASIMYTTAGDSAEQTKKAKDLIIQIIWGIVAYGFMYIGLNFLVPGGIFK